MNKKWTIIDATDLVTVWGDGDTMAEAIAEATDCAKGNGVDDFESFVQEGFAEYLRTGGASGLVAMGPEDQSFPRLVVRTTYDHPSFG